MTQPETNRFATTDRLLEKIRSIKSNGCEPHIQSNQRVRKLLAELILDASQDERLRTGKINTVEQVEREINNARNNHFQWNSHAETIIRAHSCAQSNYESITDEEQQIDKAETATHRRNLKYRLATAVGLGVVIMLVYGTAQCLDINMPLRMPLP